MPSLVVAAVQSRADGEGRCFLIAIFHTRTKFYFYSEMERRPCATIFFFFTRIVSEAEW
jgi:hypothetical protein